MNQSINTIYGTARLNSYGYLWITSRKEGNCHKYLHRLIYETFHKVTLLSNAIIHHKDGNKLNNDIDNLELISLEKHNTLHKSGANHSNESCLKMSKHKNNTGYFRVSKRPHKTAKQGFTYCYQYFEKGKRKSLVSVDLEKLKQKVIDKNLIWKEI